MRKHIYGFALFVFIVASGAALYTLLYAPFKADVPPVGDDRLVVIVREPANIEEVRPERNPLSYELKSFHIDLETGEGTVEVKLAWDSDKKPPAGVRFNFGLTTPGTRYEGMAVGSYYISEPFKKDRSVTYTCKFKSGGDPNPNAANYYGYAEVTEPVEKPEVRKPVETNGDITKLVLIEKNRMAGAIPALMTHPNKK
jgi:hypothetical protein